MTFSALKKPIPLSKYATLPPLGVVPLVINKDIFDNVVTRHDLGKLS